MVLSSKPEAVISNNSKIFFSFASLFIDVVADLADYEKQLCAISHQFLKRLNILNKPKAFPFNIMFFFLPSFCHQRF